MNTKKTHIDIVLPTYNPHKDWEKCVMANYGELCTKFHYYNFSLVIVDDGSEYGFGNEIADSLKRELNDVTIIRNEFNKGKGCALRTAVKLCDGDWIIYIDYDFPYTFQSISRAIASLNDGADVVVAARSGSYQKHLPFVRKILSHTSHFMNRMLFKLPIKDTQGGMKGFNRKGRELFLQTTIDTFLFDTQFIYRAVKHRADVRVVDAEIKEGLKVSAMGLKVLFKELKSIRKIKE